MLHYFLLLQYFLFYCVIHLLLHSLHNLLHLCPIVFPIVQYLVPSLPSLPDLLCSTVRISSVNQCFFMRV